MAAVVALTVSKPSCGLSQRHTSLHYVQCTNLTIHIMNSTQYSTQVLSLLQNKHNKPLGTGNPKCPKYNLPINTIFQ